MNRNEKKRHNAQNGTDSSVFNRCLHRARGQEDDILRLQDRVGRLPLDYLFEVDANDLSPLSHDPGPVAALEQQDRVQLLKQAMAALPETLRTAVLMRDIQEFSYQEIAHVLEVPIGTVMSRLSRGKALLRRRLLAKEALGNKIAAFQSDRREELHG